MAAAAKQLQHRTVWRWHFYAGLFCIPFILGVSLTGTVFLFHPQIQHWLDRPFDHLSVSHPALVEFILRRIPPISRWLGLVHQAPAAG